MNSGTHSWRGLDIMCFYGLPVIGDPEQFTDSYREQKLD